MAPSFFKIRPTIAEISPFLNNSKFICEKCVFTLRFVLLYNEYYLRDCSGFLQIRSHFEWYIFPELGYVFFCYNFNDT